MSSFDYILWAVIGALDLAALLKSPRFPIFKSYLGWKLVLHASNLAALLTGPTAYFYTYWLTTFLNACFGMAVTAEVFSLTSQRFRRALAVWLVLAAVILWVAPVTSNYPLIFTVYSVQRIVFLLAAGLMAYSMTFKPLFGAERFGIALGFAIFSAASLLRSALGYQTRYLPTAAYITAQIVWLVYLRKRNRLEITIPRKSVVSVKQGFTRQRVAVNSYVQSPTSCD